MLLSLRVKDFAIVDHIEVDFAPGMTVLTGETGAGKSILVDALGLVLGERGGSGLVRKGAKRAEFVAEFDIGKLADAGNWLREQALDSDSDCVLRRVINEDGRSRSFVNGNAVPLQDLKKLGEMLLDIHGQHFHQSLGKRATQRNLLDHFAGSLPQREQVAACFDEWQRVASELRSLLDADADRAARLDLLTFQVNELSLLGLQPGEFDALQAERTRLQHSGKLMAGVACAADLLYDADTGNVQSLLSDAGNALQPLCALDATLQPAVSMLQEADILVSEAADVLRRYAAGLEADPSEQDRVEERLNAIQTLARKHRVAADQLPEIHEKLQHKLHDLQHAEETGERLRDLAASAERSYREVAAALSDRRRHSAATLSDAIVHAMADLGMAGGRFEVAIRERAPDNAARHGIDDIEFLISANPGQPPLPLAKVASGGELSRMSLAIQVIASDGSSIPTMVFDEVDSGVGGGIAEMVGQRLSELGRERQVLCVTHLPQVASQASHHFRISKMSDGDSTRTRMNALGADERIDELARMLGGVEITQRTRDHAAEMLQIAADRKSAGSLN